MKLLTELWNRLGTHSPAELRVIYGHIEQWKDGWAWEPYGGNGKPWRRGHLRLQQQHCWCDNAEKSFPYQHQFTHYLETSINAVKAEIEWWAGHAHLGREICLVSEGQHWLEQLSRAKQSGVTWWHAVLADSEHLKRRVHSPWTSRVVGISHRWNGIWAQVP